MTHLFYLQGRRGKGKGKKDKKSKFLQVLFKKKKIFSTAYHLKFLTFSKTVHNLDLVINEMVTVMMKNEMVTVMMKNV